MKTERRHELQTNELAQWLQTKIDSSEKYHRAILVALVGGAAIVVLAWYWLVSQSAEQTVAWDDVLMATDEAMQKDSPEALRAVADSYGGSMAGVWARLRMADMQLNQGADKLFQDRDSAELDLNSAIDNYRTARQQARNPMLQAHATMGMAQAYEGLSKLDEARTEYQSVIDRWPNGEYAALARGRLEDLERTSTKAFYDWFAQQRPQPPAEQPGMDFPGGQIPFDLDSLPGDEKTFTPRPPTMPLGDETPPAEPRPTDSQTPSQTPSDTPAGAPSDDAAPSSSDDSSSATSDKP